MWQVVKSNPSKFHFIAYCMSFIVYGALLTGLGPLIPYLAENQNVPETQYSFFFFARAFGFVVGAILVKIVQKWFSFHNILIIFSTLVFITFGLFSWQENMVMQGVYVFIASVFCAITEIVLNISLLTAHIGENQQFYVQVGHGMFGVGGFFSPFVVLYFQESTYFVLGLLLVLIVPAYYFLETPELKTKGREKEIMKASNLADEVRRISRSISIQSESQLLNKPQTFENRKTKIIYLISFMFFVYIGQEVAYGGWISSYAVLEGVSTKEQATVYSSIFWAFMTIFRFIFAFVRVKPSQKLTILIKSQFLVTIVVVFLVQILDMKLIAIYMASIFYGVSFSAMFGLFFVLPSEYGLQVTCEQGSSFLMYGQLGEGLISMVVGYLMSWFTPTMLYYSVFFCAILLYWSCQQIINTLLKGSQIDKMGHQMSELPTINLKKPKESYGSSMMNEEINPTKTFH